MEKKFVATLDGQRELCYAADARAGAFMLARWLRARNLPAWDDAFIATCNETTLASIKEDMLAEYNRTLSQQTGITQAT